MSKSKHKDFTTYLILLILILSLVALVYFFLIDDVRLHNMSQYDYYGRTVMLTKTLKEGNMNLFLPIFRDYIGNEIIFFRSFPLMLFFGNSYFVYSFSNIIFNLGLMLFLYIVLNKIMLPQRAFFITLVLLFSHFFLELLFSPYADLNFFILSSIFFVYLSHLHKKPKEKHFTLIFIVFLMFLSRNISYLLIPLISFFYIMFTFISNFKKRKYLLKYIFLICLGFLIFFGLIFSFNPNYLAKDLSIQTDQILKTGLFSKLVKVVSTSVSAIKNNGILINNFIFAKFYFPESFNSTMIFLGCIYLSQFYFLFKKKRRFWFILFIATELISLIYYNIINLGLDIRLHLPFYFIYLFPIIDMIYDLISKHKKHVLFLFIFLILLLSTNIVRLSKNLPYNPVFSQIESHYTEVINDKFFSILPIGSNVYIKELYRKENDFEKNIKYGGRIYFFDKKFFDIIDISKVHPRFRVNLIENISNADYIVCSRCSMIKNKEENLILRDKINDYNVYLYMT